MMEVGLSLRRGKHEPKGRTARKLTVRDRKVATGAEIGRRVRRGNPIAGISDNLLPSWAHSGGCAGLVGADVVKISGHGWKTRRRGRVGDVQHAHILVGNVT